MPSHPDRVRLNYITSEVTTYEIMQTSDFHIHLNITKAEIASWPSRRDLAQNILRKMYRAILGHNA